MKQLESVFSCSYRADLVQLHIFSQQFGFIYSFGVVKMKWSAHGKEFDTITQTLLHLHQIMSPRWQRLHPGFFVFTLIQWEVEFMLSPPP